MLVYLLRQLMLHDIDDVAAMVCYVERVEHQEAIERIAVTSSMDPGLDYVAIYAIEKTADRANRSF